MPVSPFLFLTKDTFRPLHICIYRCIDRYRYLYRNSAKKKRTGKPANCMELSRGEYRDIFIYITVNVALLADRQMLPIHPWCTAAVYKSISVDRVFFSLIESFGRSKKELNKSNSRASGVWNTVPQSMGLGLIIKRGVSDAVLMITRSSITDDYTTMHLYSSNAYCTTSSPFFCLRTPAPTR